MSEHEQDRSEAATPFKLEEARKRGTVAKSPDVVTLGVLAAAIIVLYAMGWSLVRRQLTLDQLVLQQAGRLPPDAASVIAWLQGLLLETLLLLVPLFGAIAVIAVVANLAQTGPVFSAKPLSPDFQRLNPATGFKRVFSMRTLYDAARSVVKLVLVSAVLGLAIRHLVPWFLALLQYDAVSLGRPMVDQVASLLFKLLLALLVIAMVDLLYTRWEFARRMRMSRRELKDEHKQREGDPRIRARLRQLRQEMLKRSQAARKLPGSDVLITNPTHLAVALSYRHGEMAAPAVVAKGAGELAARMRSLARRHGIPVVENRALARELFFHVDLEHPVPEELYPKVARILVWVFAQREARARSATA
jgi:flagellar biosynthesis protein FlhB